MSKSIFFNRNIYRRSASLRPSGSPVLIIILTPSTTPSALWWERTWGPSKTQTNDKTPLGTNSEQIKPRTKIAEEEGSNDCYKIICNRLVIICEELAKRAFPETENKKEKFNRWTEKTLWIIFDCSNYK